MMKSFGLICGWLEIYVENELYSVQELLDKMLRGINGVVYFGKVPRFNLKNLKTKIRIILTLFKTFV